jgi:hypothetical protein
MKKNSRLEDTLKLNRLFKNKKWFDLDGEEEVFENIGYLFTHLSEDQADLVHELLLDYEWVHSSQYQSRFGDLLAKLDVKVVQQATTVFLFPIINPDDEDLLKSGDHCIYMFKAVFGHKKAWKNKDIDVIKSFDDFGKRTFKNDGSEILLFIDDFIGTGDTFDNMWYEVSKNATLDKKHIYVLSLAIQETGFDHILTGYGFPTLHSIQIRRGIRDKYTGVQLAEKIDTMLDIEKKLKIKKDSFGYKKSEATITLIATPDNTFPIFRTDYVIKKMKYLSPFPRISLYA